VAEVLATCVTPVRVVVAEGAPAPAGLPRVEERLPVRAPIAAVHAALVACRASAVLVAAADLPEIQPRLLLALLALTPTGDATDVVVPMGPDGPEPLLAVYRPTLVSTIERRVGRGDLSLAGLLGEVRTREVPAESLRAYDPDLRSLQGTRQPEHRVR
jgi:molybdopterin-guanine dinucleotide biosynthesis protein A